MLKKRNFSAPMPFVPNVGTPEVAQAKMQQANARTNEKIKQDQQSLRPSDQPVIIVPAVFSSPVPYISQIIYPAIFWSLRWKSAIFYQTNSHA